MTMLISLLSFHFITSFLLNLSSSVSIIIGKKCSIDDDCDLKLICNKETNTCTCPKPYFWRDDIRACFGCAPGWLEFETKKCLLFAISHSPGVTWYQAKTTCNALIAQPMIINNNFKALQHKIDYLLNRVNTLTVTLYFHQGAWIEINNEWIETYTWCNKNEKRGFFDCVQIRQNSTTNTICLQYVPCIEHSHFICEASPVVRSELEKNIAEAKRSVRNEEIMVRLPRQVLSKTGGAPTPGQLSANQVMATTKKTSGFSFSSFSNILQGGFTAIGHISNAVGNYYNSKNQNQQSQMIDNSYNQQMPQALESNDNSNFLLYGVIGVVVLIFIIIIIIIIIVVCSKKKHSSRSTSSIRTTESDTSDVSTE